MMELLEWLQLLNDLENQLAVGKNANNIIFAAYLLLAVLTKRVAPLAAFFLSVILVSNGYLADRITETNMYLLTAVIYTYLFDDCITKQSKFSCVIILSISICLALDARLYGVDSYYGEQQTILYKNIEYIALCAHLIYCSTFVSISRILNSLRDTIDSIGRLSVNSDYLMVYWYNVSTTHKK